MAEIKDLLPLVGVGVGWALTEFSQVIRGRREDKKAIAKALSDLLLIHHQLSAVPRVVNELSSRFKVPIEGQIALSLLLDAMMPQANIAKRYDESVSLIAAADPLLGFRLRSNDLLATLMPQIRAGAFADKKNMGAWPNVENWFLNQIIPELEARILEVARLHGWKTWWKTRRRLKKRSDLPAGYIESFATTVIESFSEHGSTTGEPPTTSEPSP